MYNGRRIIDSNCHLKRPYFSPLALAMEGEAPKFACLEEEVDYWKDLAMQYKRGMAEAREELDEFQENSRQLEQELETQLEDADNRIKGLRNNNDRLQMDNDNLRDKLDQVQRQSHAQISNLQDEVSKFQKIRDDTEIYVRQLEQANDDLERSQRAAHITLEDLEARLNCAIERNVFFESELEEMQSLKELVQRLKDEARDLKQELVVRVREPLHDNDILAERAKSPPAFIVDSNKLTTEMETQTLPGSPSKMSQCGQPMPLTPSARISALNIVGDLLRKVGALESKLASCRNYVKENPQAADPSNKETYRGRRISRGASSPSVQGLIRA